MIRWDLLTFSLFQLMSEEFYKEQKWEENISTTCSQEFWKDDRLRVESGDVTFLRQNVV